MLGLCTLLFSLSLTLTAKAQQQNENEHGRRWVSQGEVVLLALESDLLTARLTNFQLVERDPRLRPRKQDMVQVQVFGVPAFLVVNCSGFLC